MPYAFVFFLDRIFPMPLVPADRALLLGSFIQRGPHVSAIAIALLVAAWIPRLQPWTGRAQSRDSL